MEKGKDTTQLFNDFLNNTCTAAEIDWLMTYFGQPSSRKELEELVYQELSKEQEIYSDEVNQIISRVDNRLFQHIVPLKRKRKLFPVIWSAAAVLLIGFGGLLYYNNTNNHKALSPESPAPTITKETKEDVAPGTKQARLLLSDGKTLNLNGSKTVINQLQDVKIQVDNGQLTYNGTENLTGSVKWNVLEVPKGGTFEMKLPDGTKVWLNADSKLYFPDRFSATDRQVKVEGEAFFDVVKDTKRPFHVQTGELNVTVLGTTFNVRAYTPRHISTTLLTGAVKATYKDRVLKLQPGKKVVLNTDRNEFTIIDADLESATAWKDGYFYFKEETLGKILHDVALWYNIDVNVEGTLRNKRYSGSIDRNTNLSGVLAMIKAVSGVNFNLKGKELYVTPNINQSKSL